MKQKTFSLFFLFSLLFPVSLSYAQNVPVLINKISNAKVMLLLDDSGSMQAVTFHPDFDWDSATVTDASKDIPSIIFRLESGADAPNLSHTLVPALIQINDGYWDSSSTSSLYDGLAFSDADDILAVAEATCNNKWGSTSNCPGNPSSPKRGINVFELFSDSGVRGADVFQVSKLATFGGSAVEDSNGHEYLYANFRQELAYSTNSDWSGTWAKFDEDGDPVAFYTRAFASSGSTVVFNGKEVFLSAGWYPIEYLRWIFYEATAAQLAALPGLSRMEVVKQVVENLIVDNPNVQFGISTLNGSTYAPGVHSGNVGWQWWTTEGNSSSGAYPKIRAEIGTPAADLLTMVPTLTSRGGTPLSNTYIEVLRYFAGEGDRDPYCHKCQYTSPISSTCDGHFVVLLTDGLPTSEYKNKFLGSWVKDYDGDGDEPLSSNSKCSSSNCHHWLDDAAYRAFNADFSKTIDGVQSVKSYAVGFGIDFQLLDDFASNGGSGTAYRGDTADEISTTLQNIVSTIVTTAVSGAGVAVAEIFGEDSKIYRPRFHADTWRGEIDAFYMEDKELNRVFGFGEVLEERDLGSKPRKIIAGLDIDADGNTHQSIDFDIDQAATLRPELFRLYDNGTLNASLLAPKIADYEQDTSAETLIKYIHGIDFDDMRTRDHDVDGHVEKLGDIVYSRPVFVGQKNGRYNGMLGYTDFQRGLADEPRLLLVGANDGMLHAFDADNGQELWAYIPSSLLRYLEVLARPTYNTSYHRYYVDGLIEVEDVFVGSKWRTYAMFGLREGGSSYVVLDITDRNAPSLVYEVSNASHAGQSWSKPAVVVTNGDSASNSPGAFDWYMVVGTGEGKTQSGSNIVVYDLESGSLPSAKVISVSTSDSADTRTTGIAASQNDFDFNVDRLYLGTEAGDLYRVHVQGKPSSWTVHKLFDGDPSQPITAKPVIVFADNPKFSGAASGVGSEKYAVGVFFGTGRYDTSADVSTIGTTSQIIVGLYDPTNNSSDNYANVLTGITKTVLKNQTTSYYYVRRDSDSIYRIPEGKSGFYMNLDTEINLNNGFIEPVGMVTHSGTNVRGTILFSTFLPNTEECSIGGHGFVQGLNFRTGGGSVIDYYNDKNRPFYNGGISDVDADGDYESSDLEEGYNQGLLLPVLDCHVEAYRPGEEKPYVHDLELKLDDLWLHDHNGGIMPAVSSLGIKGVPGPPAVLIRDEQIVIQSAYTEESDDDPEEEGEKVTICHIPPGNPNNAHTITVSKSALEAHLAHGDHLGECEDEEEEEDNKVTICHIPPGNPDNAHTINVSENAWPAHEAHGDYLGECNTEEPEEEEEAEDPDRLPMAIYNMPLIVHSFHEVTAD